MLTKSPNFNIKTKLSRLFIVFAPSWLCLLYIGGLRMDQKLHNLWKLHQKSYFSRLAVLRQKELGAHTHICILNIKRYRLNSVCPDKLIFIFSNIKLISRFTASYTKRMYRKWDVDPKNSLLEDSSIKLIDLSHKSEENVRWKDIYFLLVVFSKRIHTLQCFRFYFN